MLNKFKDRAVIKIYNCTEELVNATCNQITQDITNQVKLKNSFILAVSGGSSPIPLFKSLAVRKDIPWQKGRITLIDERCVSNTDNASNEKLVKEHLLTNAAQNVDFMPLYQGNTTVEQCVKKLNEQYQHTRIDIGILGMGLDGHTASLFPCSGEFQQVLNSQQPYAYITPGTAPYQRITLTLTALVAINSLYLFIPGKEKLDRFNVILNGEDNQSPLAYLLEKREHPLQVLSCL